MPQIDLINGVKINIYNGDHRPPHVHVLYNEYEITIIIETREIYSGRMPKKQLKIAEKWLEKNKTEALDIFYQLNPELK